MATHAELDAWYRDQIQTRQHHVCLLDEPGGDRTYAALCIECRECVVADGYLVDHPDFEPDWAFFETEYLTHLTQGI